MFLWWLSAVDGNHCRCVMSGSLTGSVESTGSLTNCLIMHLMHTNRAPYSIYLIAFRQSRVPVVDLVSDPPTQLSTPSRGAEPSSESAASLMLDLLHGTVFHTISIKSVTLVFSSAASKLNYFVEHTSLVLVSAPGRYVNSV